MMVFRFILPCLLLLLTAMPCGAARYYESSRMFEGMQFPIPYIKSMDTVVDVRENGDLDVTETFVYRLPDTRRVSFMRDLPLAWNKHHYARRPGLR